MMLDEKTIQAIAARACTLCRAIGEGNNYPLMAAVFTEVCRQQDIETVTIVEHPAGGTSGGRDWVNMTRHSTPSVG